MIGRRRRYLTEWQAVGLVAAAFVLVACVASAMVIDRWLGLALWIRKGIRF